MSLPRGCAARLPKVSVILMRSLSPAERLVLIVADNAIALYAAWNDETPMEDFRQIEAPRLPPTVTAFSVYEIAPLQASVGLEPQRQTPSRTTSCLRVSSPGSTLARFGMRLR